MGASKKLNALERPQLVFENGQPIALLCDAEHQGRDGTLNVQISLKK